jgi:hypothetical protein
MPRFDDKPSCFGCKRFGFRELLDVKALRLPQIHSVFHPEFGFAITLPLVDVDWPKLVAVKEEPLPLFL